MLSLLLALSVAGQIDCSADQTDAIQAALWSRIGETEPTDPRRFQRPPVVDLDLSACPTYYVSRTLHAHNARIHGKPGTIIQMTAPVTGIIGHHPDVWVGGTSYEIGTAHGWGLEGKPAAGYGGPLLEIENIEFRGPGRTATGTAAAIVGNFRTVLRNVTVRKWPGHGIDLDCDVKRNPGKSNCSGSRLDNVAVHEVGGDALHVKGGDSNAHLVTGFAATYYSGWCINGEGFLGSAYYGLMCHGLTTEAQGALRSTSLNARSVFQGYIEGAQSVDVVAPSYVIATQGGLPTSSTLIVGPTVTGSQKWKPSVTGFGVPVSAKWPANEQTATSATAESWSTGGDVLRLKHTPGLGWLYDLQSYGPYRSLVFTDKTTTGKPRGRLWLPSGYLVGSAGADVRWESCPPTADPATRPLASVVHCTNPVLGQALEWVVVTSSTSSARIWAPH